MDLIGSTIGNYTVVRRLGAGGMGEVYEAQQPTIGARVAIKVLNADATDPASAQRFLIEAQAVNRIQHDGVVKILDAGYADDGRPYLVMEFLDGASLAEVMKAPRRLPMGSACRVVADVLDALADAHKEGIVHRDLKPHNVFLTRSGRTVVLDFGVAKLLEPGSVSLTLTGAILGTPAYMAPEQIQGETIDGRADLYAVGVVLYELVTGRRPFDDDQTFDLLTAHVERRPPPPRAIRPDVPEAVQAVLMSALAKDREARFQTAEAMRAALLQAAAAMPAEAFAALELPLSGKRPVTIPPVVGRGPSVDGGPHRAATGLDVTVKGKTSASPRAGAAAPHDAGEEAMARTVPEGVAEVPPVATRAPDPPAGVSRLQPRSRRPIVVAAVVLGVVAVIAAFAIGRRIGSRDVPPPHSALVTGSAAPEPVDPFAPADAAPAPVVLPRALPREIEQRLIRRRLHVADLRPEVIDFLRLVAAEDKAGPAHAQLPAILLEIDHLEIDQHLVEAKLRRVEDLFDESAVAGKAAETARSHLEVARGLVDDHDPGAANDQLWKAEWWLEHGKPPP